jgi:hypothetical protein
MPRQATQNWVANFAFYSNAQERPHTYYVL